MKYENGVLRLSRRNLQALLVKLDQPGSACTIIGGRDAPGFTVIAEDDDVHYSDREPGVMHPETEYRMLHEMIPDSHERPDGPEWCGADWHK